MTSLIRILASTLRFATIVLAFAMVLVIGGTITPAQESPDFTVLYSFSSGRGAASIALLPTPSGVLYGTSALGGCATCGGVAFKLVLSSSNAVYVLHTFGGGSDGYMPEAGLVRDSYGNVYGTTLEGGGSTVCAGGCGIVFRVNEWGSETVLHQFAGGSSDGANPRGVLVIDEADNLYGTTLNGGAFGRGTVFMVDKEGTETVLYSFTGKEDGGGPYAGLVRDASGNLYGTTVYGGLPGSTCTFRGVPGCGTVFMLDKAGKETVLYSFAGGPDGANPQATLVMDTEGRLYGTTTFGGAFGSGTVFMVGGEGRETVQYSFSGGTDGGLPVAGVVRDSAGNLYGTTLQGGSAPNRSGTVFKVTPSGQETVLHSFTAGEDGGFPQDGGLSEDAAGNLYGTTEIGGAYGPGVAFRIHP
jgi:uncharacterized repeat protein (TIGR03803 family)